MTRTYYPKRTLDKPGLRMNNYCSTCQRGPLNRKQRVERPDGKLLCRECMEKEAHGK